MRAGLEYNIDNELLVPSRGYPRSARGERRARRVAILVLS
jgi:hypothetical protein